MRILLLSLVVSGLIACGPAVFSGDAGSQKATGAEAAAGDAAGSVSQETIALCAANGMVPKPNCDSDSDDDSASLDDDSVDGVSADGISSDDDSSDDVACADLASCLKKKCEPAAAPAP